LQQHEADHGGNDHEVDDDDDGQHGSVRLKRGARAGRPTPMPLI
jgi:hypothetical protein